ncbi:MAG: GH36 C-terminal domain-containing protein, partial [Planktomarina sp.]
SGQVDTSDQISPRPLRLTQLDQAAQYQVALTNRDQVVDLSRGAPALKTTDITASGTWLMAHGILLPWAFPGTMWVLEGHKL